MPTDDEPPDDAVTGSDDSENDASRRRLIRRIALLALLVPIVVELFTFGGLLRRELFGGDTPTATSTRTDLRDAVGVGDELLDETAARETVGTSEVRSADSGWTYVLGITVENGTEASVELRVEGIELRDGATIEGIATTGEIPPGDGGELTRAWDLPDQTMPTGVAVTAIRDGDIVVSRTVPVERPPIRG